MLASLVMELYNWLDEGLGCQRAFGIFWCAIAFAIRSGVGATANSRLLV